MNVVPSGLVRWIDTEGCLDKERKGGSEESQWRERSASAAGLPESAGQCSLPGDHIRVFGAVEHQVELSDEGSGLIWPRG